MGYYSDVRVATTASGWLKAKRRAKEIYRQQIKFKMDDAMKNGGEVRTTFPYNDGRAYIEIKGDNRSNGWDVYDKELPDDTFKLYATTDGTSGKDKYVLYGFDSLKWLGYSHLERKAWEAAWNEIEEPVKVVMQGEDGASDEIEYGDDVYLMPFVEISGFNYSDLWNFDVWRPTNG